MEKGLPVPSVVSPFRFILIGELKGLHHGIMPSRKIKKKKKTQARLPLGGAGMLGCHSSYSAACLVIMTAGFLVVKQR